MSITVIFVNSLRRGPGSLANTGLGIPIRKIGKEVEHGEPLPHMQKCNIYI